MDLMMMTTTLAADDAIARGVELLVVGMAVVFVALILVGLALVLIRRLLEPAAPSASVATPGPSVEPAVPAAKPYTDPHLIVVLSAAAAAVCGAPVRVRKVRFLRADRRGGWAERGRVDIQTSHNLQTRKRSS